MSLWFGSGSLVQTLGDDSNSKPKFQSPIYKTFAWTLKLLLMHLPAKSAWTSHIHALSLPFICFKSIQGCRKWFAQTFKVLSLLIKMRIFPDFSLHCKSFTSPVPLSFLKFKVQNENHVVWCQVKGEILPFWRISTAIISEQFGTHFENFIFLIFSSWYLKIQKG